ncbi:PKD domain-containing protein [Pedobacter nyackensis]|uniref:PKD repeat-containing protein n=1 Tax=Pedobacter nyackensis TaxID=475255 RepID=A0A1W2BF69_9SPHI|nr:PKD domain-containing protein [Pedobacter nyackensis]SMC71516.1 PKD repeat-containing protein [Pedobacter nyackensis]
MVKRLLLLTITLFFLQITVVFPQITIGTVDAGPYTPGSSIAATFAIGNTDCIGRNNDFNLILVSPSNVETSIGTYTGFYSAFVNGTIPTTTIPGAGYRVKIRSTNPVLESALSTSFTISAGAIPANATINSPGNVLNPVTFGKCNASANFPYNFVNTSNTGNVSATITNQLTAEPQTTLVYTSVNDVKSFSASLAHYTIFVRAEMPDGTVGTRAYFLVNNRVVTAFATTGSETVCFPTGAFEYAVTVDGANSIAVNFPGNIYRIRWGDGREDTYTYCEIVKLNNKVSHTYDRSSCGVSNGTVYNAFQVNVQALSPFTCGEIGSPLFANARVVGRPINIFTYPPIICLGDQATFANESIAGQRPNSNSNGCSDNTVTYTWWVDGVPIASAMDVSRNFIFRYTFLTKGNHVVRLTSNSDGECQADPIEHTVCVQDPPRPAFTLSSNLVCLSSPTINANSSSSVLDNTCPNTPVYTWSVIPTAGVTFNRNDVNPNFSFAQTGTYNITLSIRSGTCSVSTQAQRVVVNSPPQALLSGDANLCARGDYTFAPNGSATNTTVSGTTEILADTYTWTVSGAGGYTFVSPSTANSQYPTINFQDFGTYTVTLTHKNNCNTITDSQVLTFTQSPTASITATPNAVCFNDNINLTGLITNPTTNTTFQWLGAGTFSPSNDLTTTYSPTPSERTAGVANIRLRVSTGITGTCAVIFADISVVIYPNNISTNPIPSRSQEICSGDPATFTPSSFVTESTFRWTAAVTSGTATGFSASGTGNINNNITNNSTTQPAVVEYTIIPEANGCDGEVFKFIVTVNPRPTLTATAISATICSGQSSAINLSVTNTPGSTTYTWTSSSNGVSGNTINPTRTAVTSINDPLTNSGTMQGTVTYTIIPYSQTGCPGTPVDITINVDPALTQPRAGTDRSICSTNSYTLEGNPSVVGTGTWTLVSANGPVTFADEHLATTTVNGLVAGRSYTFRWTIDAMSACFPVFDEVTITVNEPTIPGTTATTVTTVCANSNTGTITLSGNLGNVLRWESSLDGTNWSTAANTNTTTTYTFNNLTQSTQFRAVVQNGGCTIENSTPTIITATPADTRADAGIDRTLCDETSVTLQANGSTPLKPGETGLWTLIPANPANPTVDILNPTNPTTIVEDLVAGQIYTFRWTITGPSACGPTFDDIILRNNPAVDLNTITTSAIVCNGQQLVVDGSLPIGGAGAPYTYTWETNTNGGTWTVITGQTGEDLTITLTTTGNIGFRRIVNSGGCTSTSNENIVTVQPPIQGNTIAADQTICSGTAPALLTGTGTLTGGNDQFVYQWQSSTDNTNWTDVTGAQQPDYQPLTLTTTTYYRRLVSTAACAGNFQNISNTIQITINPNARAEYTWLADTGCAPFPLQITTIPYPDRNATYTWFANGVQIGTGTTFPGYTIQNSNERVTIRLAVASSLGCASAELPHDFSTNQAVPASFTPVTTSDCGPLTINFVNTSLQTTGATFRWNFGNGRTSNSANPPAITFQPDPSGKDTTYTVTLYSATTCGIDSAKGTVLVKSPPKPVFSPSTTSGCSDLTVNFTNNSPLQAGITYTFNFGDGTQPVETNDRRTVTHIYRTTTNTQTFNATLTAQNQCGTVTTQPYAIVVRPNTVNAELVVNGNQLIGCAPFTVTFDNNSTGATTFTVDFNDGTTPRQSITSPERFTHTFITDGTYVVTLTATNGCSTRSTTETITVLAQPKASFTSDIRLGCADLNVHLQNTTQGGISYVWDFGDGSPKSSEVSPHHIYKGDQEYYTVTLIATNNLGCSDTVTKTDFIRVVPPPIAAFNVNPSTLISIPNYTFKFEDESTNGPTIWEWDFGDGMTSALKNPNHTYLDTGTYKVTLKVTNQQGCFTTTFKNVTIKGVPGYLFVPNSFIPGNPQPELREFRAKGSGILSWRFSIFNKWGQVLWETTKLEEGRPAEGWDGTFKGEPMPQGVYYWKIDVQMVNGSEWKGMTYDNAPAKRTGPIHLIR